MRRVDPRGQPSQTRWRCVAHTDGPAPASRIELQPLTGRSHQLRVHMQTLGHPILGDALYAPPDIAAQVPRLLLHACTLAFVHPLTGARLAFTVPAAFPFVPMNISDPATDDTELLVGYPASFLGGVAIETNLYASSAFTNVRDLYAFSDLTHVDLVSVAGTILSQSGSSGGAAVNTATGKLAGIIVTATDATTTAQRDLRALTMSYINRSLTAEGFEGVSGFLSQDLSAPAAKFSSTLAVTEKQQLVKAIEK